MSLRFRYQPPNLAISTLYWKAWPLLLVVAAFNPENIGEPPPASSRSPVPGAALTSCRGILLVGTQSGAWPGPGWWAGTLGGAGVPCSGRHLLSPCSLGLAAWEEYPTLKMLMEMVMTK